MGGSLLARALVPCGHLCRLALAAIYLTAGFSKGLDPEAFVRETAQYGILPAATVTPFAFALIAFEVVLGSALLLDWRRGLSMAAGCGLMAVFMGAIAFALLMDRPLEACGCFGKHVPRTPGQTLVEDAGFLAAGLFGFWALGGRRAGFTRMNEGRRWKGAELAIVAVITSSLVVASPHLPIDDFATALAPGVRWADLDVPVAERRFSEGRHFVAILNLEAEASAQAVGAINGLATRMEWETAGLYAGHEERLVDFTFTRGPAFPLYETSASDLGRLHRRTPRYFAILDGEVVMTWNTLPSAEAVVKVMAGSGAS